jgi:hypothetical protein
MTSTCTKPSIYGGQFAFCSTLPGALPANPAARDGWDQLFVNKGENAKGRITGTNVLDVALVSLEDAARSATSRAKRQTKSGMMTRNTKSKSKAAHINIDETANQPDGVMLVHYKATFWDSGTQAIHKMGSISLRESTRRNPDAVEPVL